MGNCVPSKAYAEEFEMLLDPFIERLSDAAAVGDAMSVAELLDEGADPNAIDPDTNGTALMVAATVGQTYVVSILIEAGADVDYVHPDFGMTALLWAANNAHVKCVEMLLEAGADPKAEEVSGLDGRDLATENMRIGWEKVVDLLNEYNDDGNSKGFEAERAMSAARTKRMQAVMGAEEGNLAFLQTSETMNRLPEAEAPQKKSVLAMKFESGDFMSIDETQSPGASGSPGAGNRQSQMRKSGSTPRAKLARKPTFKNMVIKGVNSEKDEKETHMYLEHWGANPEVRDMVHDFLDKAKNNDRTVTPVLSRTAKACGGSMYGLDFRIKSMASLARKVLEKSKGDASKVQETLDLQNDALRYTILFDTDFYVAGVKEVERVLEGRGILQVKMKNFWRKPGEGTDYMGINAIYRAADGFPFEVQYHTKESIDTKMQRCHHSYEKFREDHSMAKAQYWEEMVRMWALVPIPPKVLELGTLAVHKVSLDDALVKLTKEERDVIAKKQELEDAVMPKCEAVTSHTLTAEGNVTPILEELAASCGITLHGLDFRVKSGLSMARKVVSQLHGQNIASDDEVAIEAAVWCQQRQSLRYTLVCNAESYTKDVRNAFRALNSAGFTEEFVWNYWQDTEPYNVIRSRLWSEALQAWCFLVFHTWETLEMSEARLAHYQKSMGLVFHTATFQNDDKLDQAVKDLKADESWAERVKSIKRPPGAETIGKLIITEEEASFEFMAKPSTSTQATMSAAKVNKTLAKILGMEIAQLLANGEAAEDSGKVEIAIAHYAAAEPLLAAMVEDPNCHSSLIKKTVNMAKGELYSCQYKQTKLNSQIDSRREGGMYTSLDGEDGSGGARGGGGGGQVVQNKPILASVKDPAADTVRKRNMVVRMGKKMSPFGSSKETEKVLRHNVLTDSLGASTRRFVIAAPPPPWRMVRRPKFMQTMPLKKAAEAFFHLNCMAGMMPGDEDNNERIITALFERVDDNDDGELSLEEFKAMNKLTGLSKRNLARLFVALDTDGDGEITLIEFLTEMMAFYSESMKNARYTRDDLHKHMADVHENEMIRDAWLPQKTTKEKSFDDEVENPKLGSAGFKRGDINIMSQGSFDGEYNLQ
jgi:hypothetical protein